MSAELERSDGRRSCHVAAATGGHRSGVRAPQPDPLRLLFSGVRIWIRPSVNQYRRQPNPARPGPARYFRARQPSGRASCRAKIAGPGLPVVSARHHIARSPISILGSQICNSPIERLRLLPDVIPQVAASIGRRILSPSSPTRCLRPSSPDAFERPHTSPIVVRPDFSSLSTNFERPHTSPIAVRPDFS